MARYHTPWERHLAYTDLESAGLRCCALEERPLPPESEVMSMLRQRR